MNKYKLDLNYLKMKLCLYERLYNKINFDNLKDRDFEVMEVFENYRFLFKHYNLEKQKTIDLKGSDYTDNHDVLDEDIFNDVFFDKFDSSDSMIDYHMKRLYKQFHELLNDEIFEVDAIHVNNEVLLEITDTIVRDIKNSNFVYYYEQVMKKTKYHIQYYDKYFPVFGECIYNPIDFSFLNYLVRENSIMDILTATHEAFHSVIYYYLAKVDKSDYASKSDYIKEIEGFLANMIVAKALSSFPNSANLFRCDIQDVLAYSKSMNIGMAASKSLDKKGNINIRKVNHDLLKSGITSSAITRDNIYESIKSPYVDSSSYCCSYLCACDLFNLYQVDEEKAMYELLEISKLTPDNLLNNLRKHSITFMDDDFSNFRGLCNKLLQKKKS